ncbi:MAG: VOC family protein [Rhodospirillaceae bacterium]|nr:VOC family protein [Rhodospirillaceae bacterium]
MPAHEKDATFIWNELVTRDSAKAAAFFAELIGWTAETMDMPTGAYTMFKKDGVPAAGMLDMRQHDIPDAVPPHWMAYIQVPDVDASAARVADLGGTVVVPPMDIPTVGRFCVITDPTGAHVSLITMAETC